MCYINNMKYGFTLIEVVISLAILSMLTVAILPGLTSLNSTIGHTIDVVSTTLQTYSYKGTEQILMDTPTLTIYEQTSTSIIFLDYIKY